MERGGEGERGRERNSEKMKGGERNETEKERETE